MKEYLVTIMRIPETSMKVKGINKKTAINKVKDLIINCRENNVNLDDDFKIEYHYIFKANRIEDYDTSSKKYKSKIFK